MGWFTEPTLENEYDFDTIVTHNIDLYAKWEIKKTTIIFNSNGGSYINPIVGSYGDIIELPIPQNGS